MAFETKKVTVNDIEYTLQKLPVRQALELRSRWLNADGSADEIKMAEECFKHIVVEPKVKLDDFEHVGDVELLTAECIFFQYMERQTSEQSEKE